MHILFLRWALLNSLAAALFLFLGVGFAGRVHGPAMIVAALTLLFAAAASWYGGLLHFRTDRLFGAPRHPHDEVDRINELVLQAEHVFYAVGLCQLLGLVGAAIGFYTESTAPAGTAANAVQQILDGLGSGLIATITGVLCSVVLGVQHHALVHVLAARARELRP